MSQREIPPGLHGEINGLTGPGAELLCRGPTCITWHCWYLRTCDSSCSVNTTRGFPHVMVKFTLRRSSAGWLHLPALHQKGYPNNHGHRSICLWAKVSSSWNIGREQKGLTSGNQIPCWTRRRNTCSRRAGDLTKPYCWVPLQPIEQKFPNNIVWSLLPRFAEQNDSKYVVPKRNVPPLHCYPPTNIRQNTSVIFHYKPKSNTLLTSLSFLYDLTWFDLLSVQRVTLVFSTLYLCFCQHWLIT